MIEGKMAKYLCRKPAHRARNHIFVEASPENWDSKAAKKLNLRTWYKCVLLSYPLVVMEYKYMPDNFSKGMTPKPPTERSKVNWVTIKAIDKQDSPGNWFIVLQAKRHRL